MPDGGAIIFELKPNGYGKLNESDFVSLWSNIILEKNISLDANYCNLESKNRVPELEYLYHPSKK